jgi:hypothetical protein
MAYKIETLSAYVTVDDNGEEGICAFRDPGSNMMMPMVCADNIRIQLFEPIAREMSLATGKTIKLIRFSQREEIKTI